MASRKGTRGQVIVRIRGGSYSHRCILALAVALGALQALTWAQHRPAANAALSSGAPGVAPMYKVDPWWPKPLPAVKDEQGILHDQVTGVPGAVCVDSHDHIIIGNRGFLRNGLTASDGSSSIPAPPVIEYDQDGNVVNSWGDGTLNANGTTKVLPHSLHNCFVDYEDNIWFAGNADGIVQKWSHDGRKLLLQIGTKGLCDGPPTLNPKSPYPTCGNPGANSSHTLLNSPADVPVDPAPDPVTGERGSVYVADGYGNHRVAVFDSKGKYLRQWGSAGDGPGQFTRDPVGGHPHCVMLGKDGLVYACDRGQHRIIVTDKQGNLKRTINVDPPHGSPDARWRACDLAFSNDPNQTFMLVVDVGGNRVWIIDRERGAIVSGFGGSGHMAGEFNLPHTMAVDSKGNLYVAESGGGRRVQRFFKVN